MKFLINKSTAHVSLLGNQLLLAIGGNATISDADAENSEIIDAARRGWIDIVDVEPPVAEPVTPSFKFENEDPTIKGSLTFPGSETKEEAPVETKEEAPVETTRKRTKKPAE